MNERGFLHRLLDVKGEVNRRAVEAFVDQLQTERDHLRAIIDHVVEGVALVDEQGRIELYNDRFRLILGLSTTALTGAPLSALSVGPEIEALYLEARAGGARIVGREVRIIKPLERLLLASATPLKAKPPLGAAVAILLLDITEWREHNELQRRQERAAALSTMSATLAHELRNPLNSMSIHLQLLERELSRTAWDGDRSSLRVVKEELGRLNDLLEEFLVAARPTRPRYKPIDARELLTSALELLQPEIQDARVDVVIEEPERWPTMMLDFTQVRRALINVIKNAVEAMPEGGTLTVRVHPARDDVTFAFSDTGMGMTEEQLRRVFDAYYTTKRTGTGLGMAAVQRIVSEHGGRVDIESQPGLGTTVRLTFPLYPPARRLLGRSSDASPAPQPASRSKESASGT